MVNYLKAVREVNKEWLASTSTVLKRIRIPAIELGVEPGPFKGLDKSSRRRFTEFYKFFGTKSLVGSFLPVKLNLPVEFFVRNNYEILIEMLTRCREMLVEIDFRLPRESSYMQKTNRQLHLPVLRKLMIRIDHGLKSYEQATVKGWDFVYNNYQFNSVDVGLLNSILQGSTSLKCLKLLSSDECSNTIWVFIQSNCHNHWKK